MAVVLIVDDESEVRGVLRRWLEKAGYQVLEAHDATSALETLGAHRADVALCDVHMPGHDGLWLARHIRERHPTVAVVFATGEDMLPPDDTLRDGVVAYVLKPFDPSPLLAAVQRAVAWHDAASARESSTSRDDNAIDRWLRDESSE
jgi:CheY-like chemotaxis protein